MRNRRLVQLERPDSAQSVALTGQILANTDLSLLGDKPRKALYERLADLAKTQCATVHLATVFDHLYSKLERLYDEKSAQPVKRRTPAPWSKCGHSTGLAISSAESDELLLENTRMETIFTKTGLRLVGRSYGSESAENFCATAQFSSGKDNSTIEHASSSTAGIAKTLHC